MKAIAYNIQPQEKEWLVLANYKKHDITIIANSLSLNTLRFSAGKEALIVFNQDPIDADIINGLVSLGVKFIATSSFDYNHIDLNAARLAGLKIANIPFKYGGAFENMNQVITNLDNWAAGNCLGDACCCKRECSNKVHELK